VRLGLDPGRNQHRHVPLARHSLGCRQQARLADAGLAAKHEGLAPSGDVIDERRQEALFLEAMLPDEPTPA
jgi:hypothetical protein